jgi:hypothetical protein
VAKHASGQTSNQDPNYQAQHARTENTTNQNTVAGRVSRVQTQRTGEQYRQGN